MIRPLLTMLVASVVLVGCPGGDTSRETDTSPEVELIGPVLTHTPLVGPVIAGTALDLSLTAVDEVDGVFQVTVFYRTVDEPVFETLFLEAGEEGLFTGTIPAGQVQAPGLEYYVKAEDNSNFRVVTFEPEEGDDSPHLVQVDVQGAALPWTEDFEEAEGALSIFSIGWREASLGFAGGPWEFATSRVHSGTYSAVQRPSSVEVPALEDWLISPALAIEEDGPWEVSWYEYGDSVERASHSLWVSMGSADPAIGDFVLLGELAAPRDGEWARSRVVEIPTEIRGPAVYLAWRYEGQAADTWFIDDVTVQELGPDILLTDVGWDRVDPGGTSTVSVSLENGTRIGASVLVVTGTVANGSSFLAPVTLDMDGDSAAAIDLELTVDAAWPDNTRLPIHLTAVSGDVSWEWDSHIVVGDSSSTTIVVNTFTRGLLQVVVGAGDPEQPSARQSVISDVVDGDTHTFVVDLTPNAEQLPPGPGDDRWWVSVTSTVQATLSQFDIDYDGQTFAGIELGSPVVGETTHFFLPRAPNPVIVSTSSVPTPLAPGLSGTLQVLLQNAGDPTTGLTSASLVSLDPHVTVTTPDSVDLGPAWAGSVSANFGIDVLATKVDARPAEFEVTVTDEVESFVSRTSVAVPWPVLQVKGVEIDDYDFGNDDELLDPGERVLVDISLSNVGSRTTFGSMTCTVVQTAGPTAVIESGGSTGVNFSELDPGEDDSDDEFEITAPNAPVGTGLTFELSCTDAQVTYTSSFEVVIGERPWLGLAGANDGPADAVGDYNFDILNGQYRVENNSLQIRLFSAEPYDSSTAFVEMWFSSPGAEYTFYQAVAQSGVGSLRGFRFGFTPLSPAPVVTNVDATTIQIDLPLETLDLAANRVEIGFASGFCGGDVYFCDHFPNNWGDPYNAGLNTVVWLPLTW